VYWPFITLVYSSWWLVAGKGTAPVSI
jgi:hypothetical protein